MQSTETLQVNKLARRLRHLRNFSRWSLLTKYVLRPLHHLVKGFTFVRALSAKLPTISPQRRLLLQASVLSVTAVFVTSLGVGSGSFSPLTYASSTTLEATVAGDILVADENGYMVKINPQTDDSNRIGLTDLAVHTIENGETLSAIAGRYGVKVDTLMWENNLSSAHSIRVGQKLMVPPVDGISYKVAQGESIESIAKKYSINKDSIVAQNKLESGTVIIGQQIFLPGAKPLAPPVIAASPGARKNAATRDTRAVAGTFKATTSSSAPAAGKSFIFPTIGKISQGYRAGHYALDIANRSMPPIWAAGGGTVVKASTGTWGGGYGNHVIVDHGDGVKTLYAHMNTVNVSVGDWVNQGDVLGQMGNTGRVYGATGIHLHWEVMVNGVKQYPGNYY